MKKLLIIICSTLLLAACKKNTEVKNEDKKTDIKLPAELFGNVDKSSAMTVLDAKKLKAGDEVTVTGKIMGSMNPFVKDRAMFIIGDPAILKSCNTIKGDSCKTPWDVCCDSKEDKARGTLSIQVLDKGKKVYKTGLQGKNGLDNLKTVVVKGIVAEASENSTVITAEVISVLN